MAFHGFARGAVPHPGGIQALMATRRRASGVLGRPLALAAAVLLLIPVFPTPAASAATDGSVGWWSDPDFRGDLVYRVTVDPDTFTTCEIMFRFAGPTSEDEPLRWWLASAQAGFTISSREPQADQRIRAVDLAYEPDQPVTGFAWSVNLTVTARTAGPITFTAAGLDLNSVPHILPGGGSHRHPAAGFNATCEDGFTATPLEASNHVLTFTEEDEHVVADDGQSKASAAARAGIGATFDTQRAVLWYQVFAQQGAAVTVGELEHPDGTQRWRSTLHPGSHDGENRRFIGPGGDYRFHVTRAGLAADHAVRGILAGLDPVSSFDEIA